MAHGLLVAIIVSAVSFAGGLYCMVRYARTRRVGLLVVGLLLMFILPGLLLLLALGVMRPLPMGTYGPPPTTKL